jgi:uncharacterized protein YlxW (UPF0749 family)
VLLMALGFLLVVQLRAGRVLSGQEGVPTRNVYALATMLGQEREARRGLEAQVAVLNRRLAEFELAAAQRRSADQALAQELEAIRVVSGLVPLTGPGVRVTVDSGRAPAAGQAPAAVQYVDLASIVNELWASGAEAVAVSSHRVVATTGFSQVGGTILADRQRLSAPYEVVAIGDAQTLAGALNIRGGVVEGLRGIGLRITIDPVEAVTVPAGAPLPRLHYARPVSP